MNAITPSAMSNPDLAGRKLSILQEISEAITVTDDLRSIADLILDLAGRYTGAESCSLMALNENKELYIVAARGAYDRSITGYRGRVGKGIAGSVALKRQAVLVEDIEHDGVFQGKQRRRYATKSFICCPIVNKRKLYGVLNINDKRTGTAFTADEFDLIKLIANQAAMACESAFLVGQLTQKAAELEELNRKLIDRDAAKTNFLTRVTHELRTPLNSLRGALYFLQHAENVRAGERKEFEGIMSAETDRLTSIIEDVLIFMRTEDETKLLDKAAVSLEELCRELRESQPLRAALKRRNLVLSVFAENEQAEIVGDRVRVMQLFSGLIDGVSDYLVQGDAVEIRFCDQEHVEARITLPRRLPRNVLSYLEDAKQTLEADPAEGRLKLYWAKNIVDLHQWRLHARSEEGLSVITVTIPKKNAEIIQACITSAMDACVEFIADLMHIDICSVMLNNEASDELTVTGARGLDDDIVKRTRIKFGDRIAGWVALEGKPLFIEDIEDDPRFAKKSIPQYYTKSLISIPLKIDGAVVGVLNLNNKKTSEPFTQSDFQLASAISDRIAHFIKLIRSGEQRQDDVRQMLSSFGDLVKDRAASLRSARTPREKKPRVAPGGGSGAASSPSPAGT